MALAQVSQYSRCLKRSVSFNVLLPDLEDGQALRNAPVLLLLHGFAGNHFDWILGTEVARRAQERGLVIVLPSGENHFYLDDEEMEEFFSRWIVEELPNSVSAMFGIRWSRERWYLGGYSMGGYGALRNGLAFPERFGGLIGLSSALITRGLVGMEPGARTPYAGYGYYRRVFGDLNTLEGSDRDPVALAAQLSARGGPFPRIYLACGTEDFLLEDNRHFQAALERLSIPHLAVETPGGHDFDFWNAQLTRAMDWMFSEAKSWI